MKFSRRVTELAESATLAVSAKAARMKAKGIDVVSFGAGEPDFTTPQHIQQAGVDAITGGHTGYAKPASGIPTAKEAVCAKFLRENQAHRRAKALGHQRRRWFSVSDLRRNRAYAHRETRTIVLRLQFPQVVRHRTHPKI